jgi:3-oxoacyl-[acyl-carrier protein] reductase
MKAENKHGPTGLSNRLAIVTGGSRGIGRAVVELLAGAGADVVLNFVNDDQAANAAVSTAQSNGVKASAVKADISILSEAEKLVEETLKQFDRIDFLICNAGIWKGANVEVMSEALWDETLDINLKGTWAMCRAVVPVMKRQGFGRIVIVSSTAGQRGEANYSNYAASKGGQISFAKSLASELGPFGINVNCVAPGWVNTDMSAGALSDPRELNSILKLIPVGRVAEAEDIAGPIVFLCSDWAKHISGEVLNVNGGSVLCG